MNEKNLNYLKDQVKYTGFGEGLESQLTENMKAGAAEFSLSHQSLYGKDEATAILHFKKSSQDNYFFNRYELSVKPEGAEQAVKQSFYIGYDNNFTLKEAYNLISGRSVHKELAKLVADENGRLEAKGEKYKAWVKLDFTDKDTNGNFKEKQYHQNYGFNLEETLAKHPIKELSVPEERIKLMASLEKGNRQAVTFAIDGREERRYLEAAPQFKSVNQYDSNMVRTGFHRKQSQEQSNGEQQKQENKKNSKQKAGRDEEPGPQKQTRRKKGQSVG